MLNDLQLLRIALQGVQLRGRRGKDGISTRGFCRGKDPDIHASLREPHCRTVGICKDGDEALGANPTPASITKFSIR